MAVVNGFHLSSNHFPVFEGHTLQIDVWVKCVSQGDQPLRELLSETGAAAPDQPVTMVREPLEV